MSVFSSKLKKKRHEQGLSQFQLAVKADVTPSTISLLEQGKRQGNIDTIQKLAKALDVHIRDLF